MSKYEDMTKAQLMECIEMASEDEAANNGEMANYSTMRNEKKQLIRDHGRKAAVVTSNTAAEMKARRDEQRESDLASRQRVEDEKSI